MSQSGLSIIMPLIGFIRSGGMRVLMKHMSYFSLKGYEAKIIVYYKTDPPYFPTNCPIEYVNEYGEKTDRIENYNFQSLTKYEKLRNFCASIRGLKLALNRYASEYNICIANQNITAYPVAMSNIKYKFYYIQAYEAIYTSNSPWRLFLLALAHFSYYLPLYKIVNANIYTNYKNIKAQDVVLPGLDLKNFYPRTYNDLNLQGEAAFDNNTPMIIGCIGRKEIHKGSYDVGEATKILHQRGLNITLRVAFFPTHYDKQEVIMADGDKQLADFYRSLNILIAPGKIQLGAVHYPVIEAMACNVPVITTGYYPADNTNAYIVKPNSPIEIANAAEYIYYHYNEALHKASIALAKVQEFEWQKVNDDFERIIHKYII